MHLAGKGGISCSVGLDETEVKAGGNSVIFGRGIRSLGAGVSVIGTFGTEHIDPVFSEMEKCCELYSYGDSTIAIALEFTDGKLIFSPEIQGIDKPWEMVQDAVGRELLPGLLNDSDLIGLVNWGELSYATDLWKSVLSVLDGRDMSKQVIVDLSDCIRRSDKDIAGIIDVLEEYSEKRTVNLSLNESEAAELGKAFGIIAPGSSEIKTSEDSSSEDRCTKLCGQIAERTGLGRIIIHTSRRCTSSAQGEGLSWLPTRFVGNPKLMTGAGDNFNAGYALGLLMGERSEICNVYGNAASSYYIMHGHSPDTKGLSAHISEWIEDV
jgi:hypothetical protein